jgi:TolB protein
MEKHSTIIEAAILLLSLAVLLLGGCTSPTGNDGKPPGVQPVYPAIDGFPAWSPDGLKIIYMHYGITKIFPGGMHDINPDLRGLWMINADGSNPHLLLQGWDVYATWSPDGRWIAFERGKQIYKVPVMGDSLDKSRIQQLTFVGENFFPAWSPDGQWIVYERDYSYPELPEVQGIWIMKAADGTGKVKIANGAYPTWHPSGTKILYLVKVGSKSGQVLGDSVWITDIITKRTNSITFLSGRNYDNRYPRYSPDGSKIVLESQPQTGSPPLIPQIWIMNADGSDPQPLTTEGGVEPSWSPDGTKILFGRYDYSKFDPHNGTVWVMNANGSNKRQLTYGPN